MLHLRFLLVPNLRQNPLFHSGSYLRANYAFHFSIYRAAGSENMLNIIENLWLQISPYFNMLHDSGNYSTANQHHQHCLQRCETVMRKLSGPRFAPTSTRLSQC
ncbi:FCD domain-containing protein [Mesorhizobium sp. C280B]|uniref:FCD domain-containing protein n=1 Tax=unclassified Mesorhizobium TaxID=325217 RepID=UPI0003CF5579|nr:FCD domain-containing protein [Mesorhizobium sp. LSJC280B00]ESW80484.1 hypothetical protein X772_24590 [Mesorhizobium sp. LSJC280B00]